MTKEKINLGAAFEKFKTNNYVTDRLLYNYLEAETIRKQGEEHNFARAYGVLSGCVNVLLIAHGLPLTEIDKDIDDTVAANDEKQGDIY